MSEVKLNARDMQTIARALCDAQDDRDGMADAYGRKGREAKRAADWVRRYERLYVKMFGGPSPRARMNAELAAAPSVSIHDLHSPSLESPQP